MRILYLSPRQSVPVISGAKARDYFLARALGEAGELDYVYYADPTQPAPAVAEFSFCRRVLRVPAPRRYTAGRIVRGLFGRWPLPVENYTSPAMNAAVAGLLREAQYDAVHIDAIHMAACVPLVERLAPGLPVFCDWHNIESEAMQRYADTASGPRSLYARLTARRLAALERHLLDRLAGHIVCSERERAQLARNFPKARIAVIENGVDCDRCAAMPAASDGRHLLFVGQMSYHANIDGAVWFTREIWPRLRAAHADLRLTVAGSDPAESVRALAALPGVAVTGTVPDLRPYYAGALAAIVPLRVGAGTRLKILEAMAAGVPVISTALGAEGLAVQPGEHIRIADDAPESWLDAVAALADPAERARMAASAVALARQRYDWRRIGRELTETYAAWTTRQ